MDPLALTPTPPPLARIAALPASERAEPARTRVWAEGDEAYFQRSEGIQQLQLFLTRLSSASVGHATLVLSPEQEENALPPSILAVGRVLHTLLQWIEDFPPHTDAQRFGNLAFREYGARVEKQAEQLQYDILPASTHPFVPELTPYLVGGLGSFVRIDYGTGHELAFLAWLTFLDRLGIWDGDAGEQHRNEHGHGSDGASQEADRGEDHKATSSGSGPTPTRSTTTTTTTTTVGETERLIGLYLFPLYLRLVWTLQDVYQLEPAGSHGAWGLDDYCFVPYILGAAQLSSQELGSSNGGIGGGYSPRQISDPMHKPPSVARERGTSGPRTTVPPADLLRFIPIPSASTSLGLKSRGSLALSAAACSSHSSSSSRGGGAVSPPFANLFSSAVARIHVLKRGPFNEHSPLLWDLSGTVQSWGKMYMGMRRMWMAEVLGKLPVIQHFFFGQHAYPWHGPTHFSSTTTTRDESRGPTTHAQSHPLLLGRPRDGPRLTAPTRPTVRDTSSPGPTMAPWALNPSTIAPPGRLAMPRKLPPASATFVGSTGPALPRHADAGRGAGTGMPAPWASKTAHPTKESPTQSHSHSHSHPHPHPLPQARTQLHTTPPRQSPSRS